ncbi:GldG family protein [Phormidium nigroviride]
MKIVKKNWKYTFLLGPALIIAGITAGFIAGSWQPIPLGIIIAGLVIIGLWLLYAAYQQNFWGRRSTQVSSNAIAATLSILLILALINFLAARYATRLDVTESQQFTLAPQTQQVLRNLPQPVKLWVFDPTQNPRVREFLENYQKESRGKFTFEFVDPLTEPGKAQEYAINGLGEYQLESGSKRLLIQKGVVVGFNPSQIPTEAKLTNGLEEILSTRSPKVYFLQGNGERAIQEGQGGLFEAEKSLKDKNYTTAVINLKESINVPQDADAVIVAGPQKAFSEEEVKALTAYLDRGGSLMLMLDLTPNNASTGLDSLLKDWGVTLDKSLAIDPSGEGQRYGLGATVPLVKRYGDHPITQSFGAGTSFYPLARPLETTTVTGIEQKPLVWTSDESWAESDLSNSRLEFDPKSDRQGPLLLGVALTRSAATTTQATPTPSPTSSPTTSPTSSPTTSPEASPTTSPTSSPTTSPEASPTSSPTSSPTASPTNSPTTSPEASPTSSPTTSSPSPSPSPSPSSAKESRMVVLGNSQFATNGWFEQQLNGDVFINSVSWLSKPDQKILSISPKKVTNRRINMSLVQAAGLVIAWLVWPLIGLAIAAFLWWRRR